MRAAGLGGAMRLVLPLLLLVEWGGAASINLTSIFNAWNLCPAERDLAVARGAGAYVPQCDADGLFTPQQCWASAGYCWCVNINTGEEIRGTRTPPGTLPTACGSVDHSSEGDLCPSGWSRHDIRCFIFKDVPTTWVEAQSYCVFMGGSLASVHSQDVDHFLQELTVNTAPPFPHTWIGASDCIKMGYWLWADGSNTSPQYENWGPVPGTGHCLSMNHEVERTWFASSCDDEMPFICAKPCDVIPPP